MKELITGGLPTPPQPFSWAIRSSGLLFVTHGPVQADGTILQASIEEQTELTLNNFIATLDDVGADLSAMVQMTVFLIDGAHMSRVDTVYGRYFTAPYPNRASLIVAGLVAPGMMIEIQGIADLS
ncbi:RidA family protein [Jannaschia sp. 2305UL9-9]|uniref:RidA family protein n=1 Tax=Jannaschia sp. 2305UL9-9 TaxID=3121638 RepID=UPI003528AA34